MSRKTVRFREENETYSDDDYPTPSAPDIPSPPHTPSPTFSAATLSPNSSPLTPPPFIYHSPVYNDKHGSPDTTLYGAAGLHVELSHDTQITFDFSFSPFHAHNDLNVTVPATSLEAPATDAPVMKIKCYLLPWVIQIMPRHGMSHITVLDVLVGIHDALQRYATNVEFLGEPPLKQLQIQDRHARRVMMQTDKLLRRIDWLPEGKRQFLGLSEVLGVDGAYVWSLKVDE